MAHEKRESESRALGRQDAFSLMLLKERGIGHVICGAMVTDTSFSVRY